MISRHGRAGGYRRHGLRDASGRVSWVWLAMRSAVLWVGATLTMTGPPAAAQVPLELRELRLPLVRQSPRVRSMDEALKPDPPMRAHLAAFLDEAGVLDAEVLEGAARIIAAPDGRQLMATGDVVYAWPASAFSAQGLPWSALRYRIVREGRPLRHPQTQQFLGLEARTIGWAEHRPVDAATPDAAARLRVRQARVEIRPGDRLLRDWPAAADTGPVHRAPGAAIEGVVVALPDPMTTLAGGWQVVLIDRGRADGLEAGARLDVLPPAPVGRGRDDSPARAQQLALAAEPKGLAQVLRADERLSYVLLLAVHAAVMPGDRVRARAR